MNPDRESVTRIIDKLQKNITGTQFEDFSYSWQKEGTVLSYQRRVCYQQIFSSSC